MILRGGVLRTYRGTSTHHIRLHCGNRIIRIRELPWSFLENCCREKDGSRSGPLAEVFQRSVNGAKLRERFKYTLIQLQH